jgi:hypothetical protein
MSNIEEVEDALEKTVVQPAKKKKKKAAKPNVNAE